MGFLFLQFILLEHNKGIDSVVESVLDSNDLISMYADQSPCQSESEDEKPKWISTESPSTAKRRRLTDCKTENDDGSSTRRTRSKTGPTLFLKSPDNVKVIVKSKYFRSEEENLDNRLGLKRLTISVERLPPKSADDAKVLIYFMFLCSCTALVSNAACINFNFFF